MKTKCPNCCTFYEVDENVIGEEVECPQCAQSFVIKKAEDTTAECDPTDVTMPGKRVQSAVDWDNDVTMPGKRDRKPDGRFSPGDVIMERYRVLAELGQGGMGVVYKCFDETAGIEVALKALPPELSHNTDEMEDIKENFQLVSKLVHQNIAISKTLEKDNSNGSYYLIMECVEGEDLRRWIKRKRREGSLTLEMVLPIIRQIAAALDYAHEEKIIHRDIKPGNIMIDQAGHVKVLDFGLAAQIHTSMTRVSMAYHGTSGTGPYMAPEQWRGRAQGAPADQYALAVMTYEMLAGHLPFEATDPVVLQQAVLTQSAAPISGLPMVAQKAIMRGLAKESTERFASCRDFVAALEGKKVANLRMGTMRFLGKWQKPAIVVAFGVLLFGGVLILIEKTKAPTVDVGASDKYELQQKEMEQKWKDFEKRQEELEASRSQREKEQTRDTSTGNENDTPRRSRGERRRLEQQQRQIAETTAQEQQNAETAPFPPPNLLTVNDKIPNSLKNGLIYTVDSLPSCQNIKIDNLANGVTYIFAVDNYSAVPHDVFELYGSKNRQLTLQRRHRNNLEIETIEGIESFSSNDIEDGNPHTILVAASSSNIQVYVDNCLIGTQRGRDFYDAMKIDRIRADVDIRNVRLWNRRLSEGEISLAFGQNTVTSISEDPIGFSGCIQLRNGVKIELIKVSPGSFWMGSSDHGGERQHQVTLTKPYYLGKTEITQGQYQAVTGNNPSNFKKGDNYPVEQVSWMDAKKYCDVLNQKGVAPAGWRFSLPTDVQWEYACRAGQKGVYSGNLDAIGWYQGNSHGQTHPVGQKKPNSWGFYDMQGNVCEWCADPYVYHRGGWYNSQNDCGFSNRINSSPHNRSFNLGFRVALVCCETEEKIKKELWKPQLQQGTPVYVIYNGKRNSNLLQSHWRQYQNDNGIIRGEFRTKKNFAPPYSIHAVCMTDSTNIRFRLCRGELIFNWEMDLRDLRIDVPNITSPRNHIADGKVPTKQWVDFWLDVTQEHIDIYVDGKFRHRCTGHSLQDGPLGVHTNGANIQTKEFIIYQK